MQRNQISYVVTDPLKFVLGVLISSTGLDDVAASASWFFRVGQRRTRKISNTRLEREQLFPFTYALKRMATIAVVACLVLVTMAAFGAYTFGTGGIGLAPLVPLMAAVYASGGSAILGGLAVASVWAACVLVTKSLSSFVGCLLDRARYYVKYKDSERYDAIKKTANLITFPLTMALSADGFERAIFVGAIPPSTSVPAENLVDLPEDKQSSWVPGKFNPHHALARMGVSSLSNVSSENTLGSKQKSSAEHKQVTQSEAHHRNSRQSFLLEDDKPSVVVVHNGHSEAVSTASQPEVNEDLNDENSLHSRSSRSR